MLIDWFTVVAQAVNFLVLVWLMKRFLYRPVLDAIDAREARIAAAVADADRTKTEAAREREAFRHRNDVFDQQRATLVAQATDEAHAEGQRLLDDARQAADALSAKRMAMLRQDVRSITKAVGHRTQAEVFEIARQVLRDLASTSLEARLADVFVHRLREMDGETKADLHESLTSASASALVRSAFELTAELRADIQHVVNETFSADVHLRFETAPDLVSGIELVSNGHKVAWSVAEYVASLEHIADALPEVQDDSSVTAERHPDDPPDATTR